MVDQWVVIDPYGYPQFFDSEDRAIAAGNAFIQDCLDADQWDESVDDIIVAKVVARPVRKVLGRRSEMDKDAWDELTGGSAGDEWFDYLLVPPERSLEAENFRLTEALQKIRATSCDRTPDGWECPACIAFDALLPIHNSSGAEVSRDLGL